MTHELKIIGKIIGTYETWETKGALTLAVNNFKPNDAGKELGLIEAEHMIVNLITGAFITYDSKELKTERVLKW